MRVLVTGSCEIWLGYLKYSMICQSVDHTAIIIASSDPFHFLFFHLYMNKRENPYKVDSTVVGSGSRYNSTA